MNKEGERREREREGIKRERVNEEGESESERDEEKDQWVYEIEGRGVLRWWGNGNCRRPGWF